MLSCIVTNFFIIKPTRCTNFTNIFCHETRRVSCQNKFVKSMHLVGFIIKKQSSYFANSKDPTNLQRLSFLMKWHKAQFDLVPVTPLRSTRHPQSYASGLGFQFIALISLQVLPFVSASSSILLLQLFLSLPLPRCPWLLHLEACFSMAGEPFLCVCRSASISAGFSFASLYSYSLQVMLGRKSSVIYLT